MPSDAFIMSYWCNMFLQSFEKKICTYSVIKIINLNIWEQLYCSCSPDTCIMLRPVFFFKGKYISLKWHRFKIALQINLEFP